jgi:predicted DNA-binding transcriptional regulator YafY
MTETLEPLGLVLKAGVWYLVARTADAIRTYRVSRVESAITADHRFKRPVDFDLVSYWQNSRAEFETSRPHIEVVLRIDPADIPALRAEIDWTIRPALEGSGTETVDGRIELRLPFERLEYAYADLVKLGGRVELIEPRDLRQRLAPTGSELVGRYRDPNDSQDQVTAPAAGSEGS